MRLNKALGVADHGNRRCGQLLLNDPGGRLPPTQRRALEPAAGQAGVRYMAPLYQWPRAAHLESSRNGAKAA